MSVFKRYDLVDEDELSKIKWPLEDSVVENKAGFIKGSIKLRIEPIKSTEIEHSVM